MTSDTVTAPTAALAGLTANSMIPSLARVTALKEEAYAITTYSLVFEDEVVQSNYRFRPGQFNMLYLPGIGEVAISISSDPAEPEMLGTHDSLCRKCNPGHQPPWRRRCHRTARPLWQRLASESF